MHRDRAGQPDQAWFQNVKGLRLGLRLGLELRIGRRGTHFCARPELDARGRRRAGAFARFGGQFRVWSARRPGVPAGPRSEASPVGQIEGKSDQPGAKEAPKQCEVQEAHFAMPHHARVVRKEQFGQTVHWRAFWVYWRRVGKLIALPIANCQSPIAPAVRDQFGRGWRR
jgi:hypothetical protein